MEFSIINEGETDLQIKLKRRNAVYDDEEGETVVVKSGDDHIFSDIEEVLGITELDSSDSDDDDDEDDLDDSDDGLDED